MDGPAAARGGTGVYRVVQHVSVVLEARGRGQGLLPVRRLASYDAILLAVLLALTRARALL